MVSKGNTVSIPANISPSSVGVIELLHNHRLLLKDDISCWFDQTPTQVTLYTDFKL